MDLPSLKVFYFGNFNCRQVGIIIVAHQVVISEAPNDEAYAATMLAIGAAGSVRSETLKAFTEEEYRKIIASIP